MSAAAVAVIEHVKRRSFTAGANQPILLNDPALAFYVEQGHLDLFAVEVEDGRPTNRNPFVGRVPAGALAFGAPILEPGTEHYSVNFQAIPGRNAVLVECDRAGLADPENFDLDVTIWIDDWIFRLSEFIVRGRRQASRDVRLLEADPDVPYPAASVVSAHHSDVLWVRADQPMRFTGRADLVVEAGALLPLSERNWFELDADTAVSAMHTPTAAVTGRLWPALDRFSLLALRYSHVRAQERSEGGRERHQRADQARRATATMMSRALGSVLRPAAGGERAARTGRTPLQAAVGLVADSIGVELDVPSGMTDRDDVLETIGALARRAGMRSRGITLAPGWWRRGGPSFVGLETASGAARPVAVLSNRSGAYRAVDPASGEASAVDGEAAARLGRSGVVLYAPVPEHVRGGSSLLRDAVGWCGRDLRTVAAMGVGGALIALLTPVLSGRLLAQVIPRVDTPMWIAMLGALFVGALSTTVFEIVRALAMLRIEGRVDERLQAAVWIRLLSLPVPFFRQYTAGDLADRANGIGLIRHLLTGATATAVVSGIFSVFSHALLFYYSWRLALVATLLVALLIGATWFLARAQMRHHRAAFRIQGVIDGLVFQMISGLSKLRIAHAEHYALARWAERFAEQKRETLAVRRWTAGQHTVNGMFPPLASIGLFAFIWYQLLEAGLQPAFDLEAFLSFNAAFGQFAAALTGLTAAWTTVIAALPLFERVQPILDARPETVAGGHLHEVSGDVEFANVVFRYLPDLPNAVDGVSFHVRQGDYVAFVGPSGSGKSTIYRLLLGFEQPDAGSVFLDGHDLASLDLPAVRVQMGVVLQTGQLLADSIFKNIASTAPLTMDEAWAAARAAGLAEDIEAMPMGMHTLLPEGGGGLSGGQKQRLLIARALARKPRILLFDEATSALDNRTQALVQASLKKLSVTRVVIAHRLSTVQDVDRIFVMEAGRIVESGRYEELMARDGAFAALARRQIV